MALYKLRTQLKGKYKGKTVADALKTIDGQNYLLKLHSGNYNVILSGEVFRALADIKNERSGLHLHSVNHRVCANCYHHHHNHFESDYCGLNGNIIKNIYDHTCNVFITKIEWLRKHGG